ncbi:MAG TPA: hypothetical protein PLH27_05010 [bacterium]|nr:hypothetical protein [bacterium]HMW32740.1 hypothetical protein [bacterium]HMW35956.1 hypothetical protein [bacterium]HMY34544.1 hypothetical protein [bacterium]HMZ03327.1 hypothetical protein [bacterium]
MKQRLFFGMMLLATWYNTAFAQSGNPVYGASFYRLWTSSDKISEYAYALRVESSKYGYGVFHWGTRSKDPNESYKGPSSDPFDAAHMTGWFLRPNIWPFGARKIPVYAHLGYTSRNYNSDVIDEGLNGDLSSHDWSFGLFTKNEYQIKQRVDLAPEIGVYHITRTAKPYGDLSAGDSRGWVYEANLRIGVRLISGLSLITDLGWSDEFSTNGKHSWLQGEYPGKINAGAGIAYYIR